MDKDIVYKETIQLLSMLELVMKDESQWSIIRKKVLDIANDVKRIE